jgi:hypothetical protein
MDKEQRSLYKTLIGLPDPGYGLCNVCRFALFTGYYCEELDLECHCGIEQIEEHAYDIWAGEDCWAFRPKYDFDDTVDLVGILLQGKNPDMSGCRDHTPERIRRLPEAPYGITV